MIGMYIVAGGLALMIGGMLYYDSIEKKRREKYRPGIMGRGGGSDSEAGSEIERRLELFREELKEFERRLYLKLAMIFAFAIAIFVLFIRCFK